MCPHALLHQHGEIEGQISAGDQIQILGIRAEPVHQFPLDQIAPRKQQRLVRKVLRRHDCFFRQVGRFRDQNAPFFPDRHPHELVSAHIHRLQQKADVQQAALDPLLDVIGIAAVDLIAHLRVLLVKPCQDLRQKHAAAVFSAANGNFPAQHLLLCQLLLCFVRQRDQLPGTAPEQHPLLRQHDAVAAPGEQLHPQLFFQLHHLPGKRRLGHMKQCRRLCDVLFPCHDQKILQCPQFHRAALPVCILGIL